jgi:catechol 2,3-dioxygenase-like lactoylglutathione lyase family enzyme
MTRRTLLLSLPMVASVPRLLAQAGGSPLTVRALNHMTLTVTDRKRSLEFYQGLFGWPVQHTQGTSTGIRIGAGPQYVSLSQGGPNARPGINHICWTVEGFDVDRVTAALTRHGVTKSEGAGAGALRAWVRMRGEDAGGAREGTPEYYVNDPDGIRFQLQDPRYCGGRGVLGEVCPSLTPGKGLLVVRDYQAFTLSVTNPARTQTFYEGLFGMTTKGRLGTATTLGIGSGSQRLVIEQAAAGEAPRSTHATLVMDAFDPGRVQKALAEFGVKPGSAPNGTPGPLMSYVRTRPDPAGSARGNTAVFFTDPDGILTELEGPG